MTKQELRKEIRLLKKQYSTGEKRAMSEVIMGWLERDPHFVTARTVLCYWSMDDEVCTHDFIIRWSEEKRFLLPCVKGEELELKPFCGVEQMCPGEEFDIPEPQGECFTDYGQLDLLIVPGMAYDSLGNRLGRGKGFYDRFLRNCKAYKIGICFPFQYVEHVPVDAFDIPVDQVIK